MMKLARKISLFLLLFSASAWADRPVLLRVQGIHNVELNQNVRVHLQAIDPQEAIFPLILRKTTTNAPPCLVLSKITMLFKPH